MVDNQLEGRKMKEAIDEIKDYGITKQQIDNEKIRTFINNAKWKFTNYKNKPHIYTVRGWNNEGFTYFVKAIRLLGEDKPFFSKTFRYFEFDGYKYWTMGYPIRETIIINREKLG